MTEDSSPQSAGDTGPPVIDEPMPAPMPSPLRIPASLWVWLLLLVFVYALPYFSGQESRGAKIVKQGGASSSAAGLQDLFQAEYLTRLSLSPSFSQAAGVGGNAPGTGKKPRGGGKESFAEAAADAYRDIAIDKKGAGSARKALVLEHLQKKPLDVGFLTGVLARNMALRGEKPGAIGAEVALWRSLYGEDAAKGFDRSHTDLVARRVKALKLGILEQQVLVDVYTLAGRTDRAEKLRRSLQAKATFEVTRLVLLLGALIVAGLAGIGFLIVFVSAWAGKQWQRVGRLRRQPLPGEGMGPSFGSLIDVFVAYLAISRGAGLVAGVLPGLDAVSPVYLSAGVYVVTGILATLYLLSGARAERWQLSRIGLRTAGGRDILYGIAGYCAALPVVVLLGALNNSVFKKNDSALAPNPVLPMIAGEGSDIGRFILFCLVAIAAPLFEELFFRGVLYSALKARYSTVAAVLISAACFAVVHPMGDWLPIFGLGCVLATVRELRQSLVPGMVLHFCQNAVAFIMMSSMFGR